MAEADFLANQRRFEVRGTSDSHFAWLRTRLAIERTMMAWIRTAVSLIGFGFAIEQFFERLEGIPGTRVAYLPGAPKYLGIALIASGVLALLISIWQYRWTSRYLSSGPFAAIAGLEERGIQSPVIAVAVLLTFIGLFALCAVALRII